MGGAKPYTLIIPMRDNHDGYPEILNPYERDGQYFGVVRIIRAPESATFEFGVSATGYLTLRHIFNSRPFESMPAAPYRYFFCGSYSRATQPGEDSCSFDVRIEQGSTAKNFEFKGPRALLANLLWFQQLPAIADASHLKRLD